MYEICMNKNYKTRPTARDILSLDMIQRWAKDLNIMNHQLSKFARSRDPQKSTLEDFLKASRIAMDEAMHGPIKKKESEKQHSSQV